MINVQTLFSNEKLPVLFSFPSSEMRFFPLSDQRHIYSKMTVYLVTLRIIVILSMINRVICKYKLEIIMICLSSILNVSVAMLPLNCDTVGNSNLR